MLCDARRAGQIWKRRHFIWHFTHLIVSLRHNMGKKRILIVDDEQDLCEILQFNLTARASVWLS